MERVVPWARLIERLRPLYPKGERGRPPIGLERMLRVYFLQQWYGLADEALEDALYDSQALRSFAGIELNRDPVPDATTVLHFRHWLEAHKLTEALFAEVSALLGERGLLLRQGTIVDATIIAAPSSTKNKQKSRDPEMHQTKKGNQWYFGIKAYGHRHRRQRSRHQPDGGRAARSGGGGVCRCRLYRGRQAAGTCRPRRVLEHRDQAQHHQGVAQRGCGIGRKRWNGRCRRCGRPSSTRST
jgi:transposase